MAEKSGCRGGAKGVWLDRQSGLTVPLVVSMEAERSLEDHVARFPLPCVCRRVIEVFFSFLEAIASRLEAITVKLEVCVCSFFWPLWQAQKESPEGTSALSSFTHFSEHFQRSSLEQTGCETSTCFEVLVWSDRKHADTLHGGLWWCALTESLVPGCV